VNTGANGSISPGCYRGSTFLTRLRDYFR
jgi:hypothetical protein